MAWSSENPCGYEGIREDILRVPDPEETLTPYGNTVCFHGYIAVQEGKRTTSG